MKTSLERDLLGKKLSAREECWGKGEVSLDSDRSYSEALLERADPQDQEASGAGPHGFPGRKGYESFLIIKANSCERVGRSPMSLPTRYVLSEFLFHNLHENQPFNTDKKEEANLSRQGLENQEKLNELAECSSRGLPSRGLFTVYPVFSHHKRDQ